MTPSTGQNFLRIFAYVGSLAASRRALLVPQRDKRYFVGCVPYVLILFLAQCVFSPEVIYGQQIPGAELHYNLGIDLEKRGEAAEAAVEFIRAIQINPEFEDAYYELGRADMRCGNLKGAITALTQLIEFDPGSNKGRLLLAQIYSGSGNDDRALALYSQALRRGPSDPRIYYEIGKIAYLKRDYSQSVVMLDRTLNLNPAMNNARRMLISALEAIGDYKDAIERLHEAVLLQPRAPDLLTNLGELYIMTRRFADAERSFTGALSLQGTFIPAQIGLGTAYRLTGRLPAAIEIFSKIVQSHPMDPRAYLERGRAEYAAGDIGSARTDFESYNRMAKGRPEGNYFLGILDCAEGNYTSALGRLKRALSVDPKLDDAYYYLAVAYINLNEPKEAKYALTRYVSLKGSSDAATKLRRELQLRGARFGAVGKPPGNVRQTALPPGPTHK